MAIGEFIKAIKQYKAVLIVASVIGFIILALFGYMHRNDVNESIVYCSTANIFIEEDECQYVSEDDKMYQKKNEAIVTSDTVISKIKDELDKKQISMTVGQIQDSIIVDSADDIVTIKICDGNPNVAKIICDTCTNSAVDKLNGYLGKKTIILNSASEPFTAVVDVVDDIKYQGEKKYIVTQQSITSVTASYIIKICIKYGIFGAAIFVFIAAFIVSIKVLMKEEK